MAYHTGSQFSAISKLIDKVKTPKVASIRDTRKKAITEASTTFNSLGHPDTMDGAVDAVLDALFFVYQKIDESFPMDKKTKLEVLDNAIDHFKNTIEDTSDEESVTESASNDSDWVKKAIEIGKFNIPGYGEIEEVDHALTVGPMVIGKGMKNGIICNFAVDGDTLTIQCDADEDTFPISDIELDNDVKESYGDEELEETKERMDEDADNDASEEPDNDEDDLEEACDKPKAKLADKYK